MNDEEIIAEVEGIEVPSLSGSGIFTLTPRQRLVEAIRLARQDEREKIEKEILEAFEEKIPLGETTVLMPAWRFEENNEKIRTKVFNDVIGFLKNWESMYHQKVSWGTVVRRVEEFRDKELTAMKVKP